MPTVIDSVLYNAMLQARQGGVLQLTGGRRVYPQCHCCISGNTVGVYKDPVAILRVSETELCDYRPISVSFDTSFSASSTLQTWSVNWDDGNISNGAWPPPASVAHPAGGYTIPGVYTILLTITDLLGATDYDAVDVHVLYCPPVVPVLPGIIVGGEDFGVAFCLDLYETDPVWVDLNSAQLTVVGSKRPRCLQLVQNANYNDEWQIFAGTDCGIYRYRHFDPDDPLAGNWSEVVSITDLQTLGGHSISHVHVWTIDHSIDTPGTMYAVFGARTWPWTAVGVVVTSDYFDTIDRVVYVEQQSGVPYELYIEQSSICYVQGSGGAEAWVAFAQEWITGHTRVYYTNNSGVTWNLSTTVDGSLKHDIHTPYIGETDKGDNLYVLAADVGAPPNPTTKWYSINGGVGWNNMGCANSEVARVTGHPYVDDTVIYITDDEFCQWSGGAETVFNLLPNNCDGNDLLPVDWEDDRTVNEVVLVGNYLATGYIHLWDPTQIGPQLTPVRGNKIGNWNTLTGGVPCLSIANIRWGWPAP